MTLRNPAITRYGSWLALMAVLLMALMPTITALKFAADGSLGQGMASCHPGAVSDSAYADSASYSSDKPDATAAHHGANSRFAGAEGHCPYCLAHLVADVPAAFVLPPRPTLVTQTSDAAPATFAVHTLWSHAQPRAPPALT